jgi:hypothetical protein
MRQLQIHTIRGAMDHQSSPAQRDYGQPFNWWGYRSTPEHPLSIVELIDQGTLDSRLGAFLWIAMEQRASLIVAATPHEAGKTTMLTALLDFLRPEVEMIYLRGWYERFDFMSDGRDPAASYLLSNEISSHLPIYMWGRGVRKLFEAAGAGYGLAATVHAESADGVIRLLANYPLEVPPELLTEIDLVLTLSYRRGSKNALRRVMRLELIEDVGGYPIPRTLAAREVISTELQTSPGLLINTLVRHFGLDREYATDQFAQRVSYLDRLVRSRTLALRDVREAIRRFSRPADTF